MPLPGARLRCIPGYPHTWEAGLGRSCPDFSISSRKLRILCSLASDNSVPSSGGPAPALSVPSFSRLSAVRELASSCRECKAAGRQGVGTGPGQKRPGKKELKGVTQNPPKKS